MRLSCIQADRIFLGVASESLKPDNLVLLRSLKNMEYGTHAGKRSVHGLFWAKKFRFSRIWGFHKNYFIKPSFSYRNRPDVN